MQSSRKPLVQVGWVVGGYALAVLMACAAVACHLVLIGGPNNPNYTGMNVFGDALLFLAVFGISAAAPTSSAYFFLQSYPGFWRNLVRLALPMGASSVLAFAAVALSSASVVGSLAFLWLLLAPLFAIHFGLAALFAPNRETRNSLWLATGLEAMGFVCWVIWCLLGAPGA